MVFVIFGSLFDRENTAAELIKFAGFGLGSLMDDIIMTVKVLILPRHFTARVAAWLLFVI